MSAPCPILAFVVTIRIDDATAADTLRLTEDLNEFLDRHGLTVTGPSGRTREYLIRRDGAQATDEDRTLVRGWASRWASIASVDVGDIVDISQDE